MEENELKHDATNRICRCCLSVNKLLLNATTLNQYFMDLAGIDVLAMDGLPQWICYECSALLQKAMRFKYKMLRAQSMLYEYVTRCAPFPIDGTDPELMKYCSPQLVTAQTLVVDSTKKKLGFHKVLEHTKTQSKSELCNIQIVPVTDRTDPHNGTDMNDIVKEEQEVEFEDDIPLQELRSIASDTNEFNDTMSLENNELVEEIKTEPEVQRNKKKKEIKTNKRKRNSDEETELPVKKSIRKPIDIDPTKIKIIMLNPEEQFKQRELESKASLKFPFQCHLCYKGFNFASKLENHMTKHSPSRGPYECTICKMYLPTAHSFSVHSVIHTRRYECLVCGVNMTDKGSINHHYRTQHEGITTVITCHLCGKVSSNTKTHRGHMRNHHSGERPKCDQCGKSFVNKDSLIEHLAIHSGVKHYQCNVCGKPSRTRGQMKMHLMKHTNVKDFYCVECDIRFKTACSLRQHLKKSLKHVDVESLKHACPRCPRRYNSPASLNSHILINHDRVRPYSCSMCGAALATSKSLQIHKRSVHGSRGEGAPPVTYKNQCHTCGKAFGSKATLSNHLRTHTGERPFKCVTCGRSFSQRSAMNTHQKRVHRALLGGSGGDKPTKVEPPSLGGVSWPRPQDIFYVTAGP